MYPEIHYQIEKGKTITVYGCYGENPEVILPNEIGNVPVTKIADYGFADAEEESGLYVFTMEPEEKQVKKHRLCGGAIETVHLSQGIREIGRYAFYRCFRLKELFFTDQLESIGGGAFTGCQLNKVHILCRETKQTCLRQILEEQRFELEVHISYENGEKKESATLIFPEHYEEAVENTPARIVETRYHGAGGDYRQCVYHREIDFEEYDRLFGKAKAREGMETLIRIAVARLEEPYQLSETAREEYEEFLRESVSETMETLLEKEQMDTLFFLVKEKIWDCKSVEIALTKAEELGNAQATAILLDAHTKKRVRKTFEL